MEKQIALVRKSDNRVENVLIVESLDKNYIKQFETVDHEVIVVKDSTAYVHGLWDGEVFTAPKDDYLISIGLMESKEITDKANAAKAKAEADKAALLARLGLTEDELKTILG